MIKSKRVKSQLLWTVYSVCGTQSKGDWDVLQCPTIRKRLQKTVFICRIQCDMINLFLWLRLRERPTVEGTRHPICPIRPLNWTSAMNHPSWNKDLLVSRRCVGVNNFGRTAGVQRKSEHPKEHGFLFVFLFHLLCSLIRIYLLILVT